jgi:hypothetical protein
MSLLAFDVLPGSAVEREHLRLPLRRRDGLRPQFQVGGDQRGELLRLIADWIGVEARQTLDEFRRSFAAPAYQPRSPWTALPTLEERSSRAGIRGQDGNARGQYGTLPRSSCRHRPAIAATWH